MEETDFEKWLRLGLGRAILVLRNNNVTPYREAILFACLNDQRYDRQIDESRGAYLYDLLHATGEPDYYRDRIIASLFPFPKEGEEAFQYMEIVRYFAAAGDDVARKALSSAFLKNAQTRDYRGAGAVIELDGIEGFRTVMTTYLQTVGEEEDGDDVDSWVYDLEKREGEKAAQEKLKALAAQNSAIGKRLASVTAERTIIAAKSKQAAPALSYEDLTRLIEEYCAKPKDERVFASASRFRSYGRRATQEALKRATLDIAKETNGRRLLPLLRLFACRPFPGDVARLIALTYHEDESIVWAAMQAMENIHHEKVRALASQVLRESRSRYYGNAVNILTTNFVEGDYGRFEPLLREEMDADHYHWLGIAVRKMVEKYPGPEAIPCLLTLYENEPCGHCRGHGVELLAQLDALTEDLWAECRYDAYPGTREWMAEQDAKP